MTVVDFGASKRQPPQPKRIEKITHVLAIASPIGWLMFFGGLGLASLLPAVSAFLGGAGFVGAWLILIVPSAWLVCLIATLFSGGIRRASTGWLSVIPRVSVFNPLTLLVEACAVFGACI